MPAPVLDEMDAIRARFAASFTATLSPASRRSP